MPVVVARPCIRESGTSVIRQAPATETGKRWQPGLAGEHLVKSSSANGLFPICREKRHSMVSLRQAAVVATLAGVIVWLPVNPALAQARGETVTIHYTLISPIIALLAGILILIVPRLLNYIVAIYLILIGLVGIFGR
jgi:hypothetical protein